MPKFPLEEAVAEAWEEARKRDTWGTREMARVAVAHGTESALAYLIQTLKEKRKRVSQYELREIRRVLLRHLEARGSLKEIVEWYDKNKDNLVFDKQTKKFRVRQAAEKK